MTRWMRFLLVAVRSLWRPRLGPTDTSLVTGRVWPTDVDVSATNNAAYLVFLEMGRVDLQLRSGLARLAARKGWTAPMASVNVQFRKPLRRFQRFRVSTRLAYWDDRWLYVEQRIDRNGETIAAALTKSLVIGAQGRIAPLDLAAALGFTLPRPSPPPVIQQYEKVDELMRERADVWPTQSRSSEGAG
jgi:acyl-CoA thioesterase FadM